MDIKEFELIEEFNDVKRLKYILTMEYDEFKRIMNLRHKYDNNYKNEDERKQTFKNIQKFCTETINNKLVNKITWTKNKCGRFYSNNSIQNLPREIKNFLTEEIMTDIDIKNCQPTLLLNICKKYNIQCSNLEYYCNNRNEILDETKLQKNIFTASINYNKRMYKIKNQYFNDYDKEIKNIQKELLKKEDFKSMIDEINEDNKKELKHDDNINLEGKLMNKIYFNFESQIILILKSLLENKGYKIGLYSYDGLMIYGLHYNNKKLLEEINKEINEEINLNYKITILFKQPEKIIKIPENWKDNDVCEKIENNLVSCYNKDHTYTGLYNNITYSTLKETEYAYIYAYDYIYYKDTKKRFGGYDDFETYRTQLKLLINQDIEKRIYYEILQRDDNIKPYFYFDIINNFSKEVLNNNINEFIKIFNKYFKTKCVIDDFLIYIRELPDENNLLTIYIINKKYNTKRKDNLKVFVDYIIDNYKENILLNTINNKIYNFNQQLNLPYNKPNIFIDFKKQSNNPEDYLISYIENTEELKIIKKKENKKEPIIRDENNENIILYNITEIYLFIIEKMPIKFYFNSCNWKTLTNILIKENLNRNLINEWCEISSKITNNKWTKEQNINFVEKYNKDKFLSGKPVLEKILKEYIKDYNIDIDFYNKFNNVFKKDILEWLNIKTNINYYDIEKKYNIFIDTNKDKHIKDRYLIIDIYKYDIIDGFLYKFINESITSDIHTFYIDKNEKINCYLGNYYIEKHYNKKENENILNNSIDLNYIIDTKQFIDEFLNARSDTIHFYKAYWGIGKTYYIINNVIEYAKKNNLKVLLITENNSLNSKLSEDIKFKSHLEDVNEEDKCNFVCSMESLIKAKNIKYDILILDEYISILKHFDSPTMKKEKITDLQNFIIFKEKLLSTKKILCLDADLDNERINILKSIKPKSKCKIYNILENKYKEYKYYILTTKSSYLNEIFKNLNLNKKIILPSNCKFETLKIYETIINEYKNINVLLLTGNRAILYKNEKEHHIDKNECIKHLEQLIITNNINCFLFTPTIKTGISINIEHFNKCIVYAGKNSICVRELIQMFYRARKLKDKEIYIYSSDKKYKYSDLISINKLKIRKSYILKTINDIIYNETKEKFNQYSDDTLDNFINNCNFNKLIDNDYYNICLLNDYETINSNTYLLQVLLTTLIYNYEYNVEFIFNNNTDYIKNIEFIDVQDEFILKFMNSPLIEYEIGVKYNNLINIYEDFYKNPLLLIDTDLNLDFINLDDNDPIKVKSLIFFYYNNDEKEDYEKIYNEYNQNKTNNNKKFINEGFKILLDKYRLHYFKHNIYRKLYFFRGISDRLEYDENLYECINDYDDIKYLLNERTKNKYKNLKIIYNGRMEDIYDYTSNKFYNIDNEKFNLNNEVNLQTITRLLIFKTLKILNLDIRYEYFITNKEFKKEVNEILKKNLFEEYKLYFEWIGKRNKYDFNVNSVNIYKTMKHAINEILNNIGLVIRYVDNRNKNTTKDYDNLIIWFEDFITERPKDIFIEKNKIKKGQGRNIFIDNENRKVYEYNKNYYSYKNYKLNGKCIEFSEKIDEETRLLRKPLLISCKEYNEIRQKLYNDIEKNDNNEIEIINENDTLEFIIDGSNNF